MHLESTLPVLYYDRGPWVAVGGARWPKIRWESADKPGSVESNHSSGMHVAVHLEQPTRKLARAARCSGKAACFPIWPCSRRGLPCHRRYRRRGALLPHPFTLAVARKDARLGGLLSVALSVGSRPPGVTWRLALWSPDFPPFSDGKQRLPGRLPSAP